VLPQRDTIRRKIGDRDKINKKHEREYRRHEKEGKGRKVEGKRQDEIKEMYLHVTEGTQLQVCTSTATTVLTRLFT
jgi:hypothetical protein